MDMQEVQIELLRKYRQVHGWSQSQAANECGVPVSTWRGWEVGKKMPQRTFMLQLLTQALKM